MNKVTPENIRLLLDRYLDGESTQEELRQLGEYLGHADRLPADLMPYAQMFALLDETQPTPSVQALDRLAADRQTLSNSPLKGENTGEVPFRLRGDGQGRFFSSKQKVWKVFLAAACLAAAVFILAPSGESEKDLAIAYVGGKRVNDERIAMQMSREALEEIFSAGGDREEQLTQIFNAP